MIFCMRRDYRRCLAAAVLLLLGAVGDSARADAPSIEITDFYFYPAAQQKAVAQSDFNWPEDGEINAVLEFETAGYARSAKVELFLVIFDAERDDEDHERVFAKTKGKYNLKAGPQRIVFDRVLDVKSVFGERHFTAKVEAALKGAATAREETEISIYGPDPPDVDILDLELYSSAGGRGDERFAPGAAFTFEATIEIGANESKVAPQVLIYAAMEEDSYLIDPELEYQPYSEHWDVTVTPQYDGEFRLRARGSLPSYFAEPYEVHHPFRVYLYVNFGSGYKTSDYARGEVYDPRPGDNRSNDDLAARTILLSRGYTWDIKRIRPALP